jgi:hypothetical protein
MKKRIRKKKLVVTIICMILIGTIFTGVLYTYVSANVTRSSRIYYDSTFASNYSGLVANLTTMFHGTTGAFRTTFGVDFGHPNKSQLSTLNGASCNPNNLTTICSSSCHGNNNNCNTAHRRGARRLNAISSSSTIHTVRMVDHAICWWSGSSHSAVYGLGTYLGRDTILTMRASVSYTLLIQHELSHNLGVDGHCTSRCIMNPNNAALSVWCSSCASKIRANI